MCYTSRPFTRSYTVKFDDGGATMLAEDSVGFDFTAHPPVRLTAKIPE